MPYPKIALTYARKANSAKRIQRKFRQWKSKKNTNMVKKTLYKMEPYKYDAFTASVNLPGSWSLISNITNIGYDPSGATNSGTRQTTKILVKNLSSRGKLTVGSGDTTNIVRIALVRGRRTGTLSLTDVGYGSGSDLDSQFNQKFVDVIWDKTYNIQETAPGAVYPPYKYLDMSTMINKICKFEEQSSAGVIQPYNNTSYYLIGCSDSTLAPHPALRLTSRVSFKQLD